VSEGTTAATISVCICTRNRAASLKRTLASLAQQTFAGPWELVVVDNGSSDATREIAEGFTAAPMRYLLEPQPGLSRARNRALAAAEGELLVFTDDDVEVDAGWLAAFASAAERFLEAGFFGGRILPRWPGTPPRWMHDPRLDLIAGLLVYYDLGEEVRPLRAADPLPFGASFALRRSLAAVAGTFRTDLGVTGTAPGRGEETDFLRRACQLGISGAYVGDALCHHAVDTKRFRLRHLFRYGFHKGLELRRTRAAGEVEGSPLTAVLYMLRGARQLVLGRGDRFRQCIIHSGIQMGIHSAR